MKPLLAAAGLVIGLAVSVATAQDVPMPSASNPSIDVGIIDKKLPNGDFIQVAAFVEARPDGLVYFQRCNQMTPDSNAHQVAILVS